MNNTITQTIMFCIKEFIQDKKLSEIKTFYEVLGFDGVYTTDDSYLDYFVSDLYLDEMVNEKLSENRDLFLNKLKNETRVSGIWARYEELILL